MPSKLPYTLKHQVSVLEIEIRRLRLSVTLHSGRSSLHSRQYPSTMIDTDQLLSTLIGLRNKHALVLVHVNKCDRKVLIQEDTLAAHFRTLKR
ncbi:hypothetical protein BDV30DRAFT_202134 [Aspergillus minisclerotigenes]|uniref:Uncharacterized protein n=1 Tax=Aspergillus minisclerotigenes TaxID=656917 RepID=A0A5N6JL51_9EURO|nr:hypothetical protein BDV30DRAFT_202134 [Aspergillus minisclerotigenes]